MAQHPTALETITQNINIDDVEVDILILAKAPNNLKAACSFLTRRGWPTRVLGNISKAIEEIAEKRPDIVMISFNHPSPAVHKLPELIAQTFNLVCIGFVEGGDTQSTNKLNLTKIRHKIFGQPSGPNLQRGIRRILVEKFNFKMEEKAAEGKSGTDRGGTAARPTKSNPAAANGQVAIQKSQTDVTSGNSITIITGEEPRPEMKIVQDGGGSSPMLLEIQKGQAASDRSVTATAKTGRRKLRQLIGTEAARETAGNLLFGENLDPQRSANEPADTASSLSAATAEEASAPDLVGMIKKSLFGENGEDIEEQVPQNTMEKAVEGAMLQVCHRNPDIRPIPLRVVNRIGVFPVEATDLPGYLVVAVEVAQAEDQKRFLKSCENALQGTFNAMGIKGKVEPGFWLDVPPVPFEPWAESSSLFNFKTNHKGHELGIAYFQTEQALIKPTEANEKGMYTISISEISTEEPITFKAYLYLKENDKFFLYLRNGRQLQAEQKKRLEEKNISSVFMKSVDLENLRMFLAAVYLKGTIRNTGDAA